MFKICNDWNETTWKYTLPPPKCSGQSYTYGAHIPREGASGPGGVNFGQKIDQVSEATLSHGHRYSHREGGGGR